MEFKEIKKNNSYLYLLSADRGPFALIEILKGPTNKVKAYLENWDGESHPSYPNLKLAYEGPTTLDRIPKKDFKFFEANLTIFSTFLEDGPVDPNTVKRDFIKFMKSYFSKTLKEFLDLFGKNLSPLAKKINLPNTINAYLFEYEEGEPFALIEIRESEYGNVIRVYTKYGKGEPHPTYTNLELIYEGYIPFRSMNNDLLNDLAILLGVYVPLLDLTPEVAEKIRQNMIETLEQATTNDTGLVTESDLRNHFVAKKISVPNTKLAYGFYFNEELFGVLQIKDHFQYGPILEIYLKYNGRDPHILFNDLYLAYEREAPYQLTNYILRKTAETLWRYKKIFENPKIDYEEYEDKLGEDLDKIFKPLRKAKKLYKIEPTRSMNIIAKRLGTPNTIYSFLLSTSDGEDFAIVEAERDKLYGPTFKIYLKGANLYDEHSIYEDFGVVYETNLPKTLTKGMLRKIGEALYKYVDYNRLPDTIAEDVEDEIGEELDLILKNS